ncbi:MAG: TonB-dependent receptor [Chlorobi bacterium]|nr:TonB-dependent receptor [Chlorobiota bacterium]
MGKNWLWLLMLWGLGVQAQTGTAEGKVTDAGGKPLAGVHVWAETGKGTVTDREGKFRLTLKGGTHVLTFSHLGYGRVRKRIEVPPGGKAVLEVVLRPEAESIKAVEIRGTQDVTREGAVHIGKKILEVTPVLSGGVKEVLLSLPSVTQLDELSTQYLVRGGNYDENAVYIDGIEVRRPYLPRSGRREGLTILNTDLVESLRFYPGAFPVTRGDKLSSVLELDYIEPRENKYKLSAGFTGGSLTVFRKGRRTALSVGARYLNNAWIVKRMEGEAELAPAFADIQAVWVYRPSERVRHEWINYLSFNRYEFRPFVKQVNFGTFTNAKALVIYYEGREKDRFHSQFSAWKTERYLEGGRRRTVGLSIFHTTEREYFDILASYFVGEPNTDPTSGDYGDPVNLESAGAQLDHARNDLDGITGAAFVRWHFPAKENGTEWDWGLETSYENVRDRIREYQMVDSAGYAVLPPGVSVWPGEPYVTDTFPLLPFRRAAGDHLTETVRGAAYAQMRRKLKWKRWEARVTAGLRAGAWHLTDRLGEGSGKGWTFSPRLSVRLVPQNDRRHAFRLSAGLFMQPPAYREFRDESGQLHPNVRAQKAWNFSVDHRFRFTWGGFPMVLSSAVYFRYLYDVNPYKLENLRIRYAGTNNATAYAVGAEVRWYAELLPDTPSWLSVAWMKTEENIAGRGYIPRPTDQRFKMSLLFQDYVPRMPFLKMYLNNVFGTGMPTGAPLYADPYKFLYRTRNYWRTDVGLYYVWTENPKWRVKLKRFTEFSTGLEIINMFDRRNSVSTLWVREIYSKRMMGVPNYLTGRIFNLKIKVEWR